LKKNENGLNCTWLRDRWASGDCSIPTC